MLDFSGKTVAVSGAAIGFGKTIAARFAALGASVYGCDILAADKDADPRVVLDTVDLMDRRAAAQWVAEVERCGGGAIDVLVCNAGGVAGQSPAPLEEVSDDDWDRVVAINLGAAFALCRAAAPGMKRQGGGAIVTITSGAALQPSLTGIQAYCAAKHAMLGLTRQLAHELGPHGIRVNSVAPGFVQTNAATRRQWESYSAARQQEIVQGVAMRRLGTADEIAKAVLFFASDLASFVNGQVLAVDGGK
ncbi:SDR family NAD(P)-dependent oxidoreductase [Bordetella genomosp. 13]|uniref:SDR family NAD(P)-dependent oxidoreductase n=1 Tax=Bordetella genomosp. 13 TaxID=463040 RepID=UPI0011A0512B|nr:SDR family NAD(P)-dependent oxidoreductase [Bordetella genomosp. 13]